MTGDSGATGSVASTAPVPPARQLGLIACRKVSRETETGLVKVAPLPTLVLGMTREANLADPGPLPEFHVKREALRVAPARKASRRRDATALDGHRSPDALP